MDMEDVQTPGSDEIIKWKPNIELTAATLNCDAIGPIVFKVLEDTNSAVLALQELGKLTTERKNIISRLESLGAFYAEARSENEKDGGAALAIHEVLGKCTLIGVSDPSVDSEKSDWVVVLCEGVGVTYLFVSAYVHPN